MTVKVSQLLKSIAALKASLASELVKMNSKCQREFI
jgi:hypothetical protein